MIRKFAEAFFKWVEDTKYNMMRNHDKICEKCGSIKRCTSMDYDYWECEGCGQKSALFSNYGGVS